MDLPLHPMLVHIPIAAALFLPLVLGFALWRSLAGGHPGSWWPAVALFVVVAVAGSVAAATGEREEDTVESIVPSTALETHEEAAELFEWLAWTGAVLAVAGLLRGAGGRVARFAATGVSLLLVVATIRVGHAGGELVYRHGAAAAYTSAGASAGHGAMPTAHRGHDDDD